MGIFLKLINSGMQPNFHHVTGQEKCSEVLFFFIFKTLHGLIGLVYFNTSWSDWLLVSVLGFYFVNIKLYLSINLYYPKENIKY